MKDWFAFTDVELLDSPAIVIYPDRVNYNVELLVKSIDNIDRLRPHVKTHKCAEVVALCMAAGITKFKCATIAEIEMLALSGAKDVLLAYQPIGPKAGRFIRLVKQYPNLQLACLVDNHISAQYLNDLSRTNGVKTKVYIDLNVGMNRSGIQPHQAFILYQQCSALQALEVKGLHAYDGHIHDEDLTIREARVKRAFRPVKQLMVQLQNFNFTPIIVAGGTPTYPFHSVHSDWECSPGTFVYWDGGYQQACAEQSFLTAALIITRVVSLPGNTKVCVDLGHKSIAAENALNKRVSFLNATGLKFVSHSEEHLILDACPGHEYKIGDVLYGVPHHICPTVALYEKAVTIMNKQVSGEWKTIARDRKINF